MSEDIQLFDWCAVAAEASTESKAAVSSAVAKAADLENIVNEVKSQMDDLVQAKQEDETALLQKFQGLLNEKKVKIREQQKVIASGSFDENQAAGVTARSDGEITDNPRCGTITVLEEESIQQTYARVRRGRG